MNRETAKALLENGVLQAYANGEEIEILNISSKKWISDLTYHFDCLPEHYRIKPKPLFNEGNLVKVISSGCIGYVTGCGKRDAEIRVISSGREYATVAQYHNLIHVKKVLKPHTFETAVKACAEHGFRLCKESVYRQITSFNQVKSEWYVPEGVRGGSDYESLMSWNHYPNETPFAQITYEEIK